MDVTKSPWPYFLAWLVSVLLFGGLCFSGFFAEPPRAPSQRAREWIVMGSNEDPVTSRD